MTFCFHDDYGGTLLVGRADFDDFERVRLVS